ncbi:hypothetical protein J2T57_001509 [Natronocella acetinitrilica]|uniref:Uncharacterized protein n=1 Tax=Natronocella acetinitrilica TaxID=414046 RepID=A0AAE3KFS9_9GAMM|nr:hypothetical protein [Natronocella acetinitrilica]MCP1674407.1 hypothetical protein [Natronocella acetinitrilica]
MAATPPLVSVEYFVRPDRNYCFATMAVRSDVADGDLRAAWWVGDQLVVGSAEGTPVLALKRLEGEALRRMQAMYGLLLAEVDAGGFVRHFDLPITGGAQASGSLL